MKESGIDPMEGRNATARAGGNACPALRERIDDNGAAICAGLKGAEPETVGGLFANPSRGGLLWKPPRDRPAS